MTIYPYLGVCSNPHGEGYNFPMATADEACPVEDCDCTPVVYVLAAEAERAMLAAGETIASLHRERDRAIETRENANACTLRVEAERDALRVQLESARTDVDALLKAIAAGDHRWSHLRTADHTVDHLFKLVDAIKAKAHGG